MYTHRSRSPADPHPSEITQYIHNEDIPGIVGYVVNVHDPLNYDIDLLLDEELVNKYRNVITNRYTYKDENGLEHIGTTYRCRLKGIGLIDSNTKNTQVTQNVIRSTSPKKGTMRKIRKMGNSHIRSAHIELIRRCDRSNGWVLCTLSDIDIYRRLLVTIYDPITKENIGSLCLKEPYNQHFQPYELPGLIDDNLSDDEIPDDISPELSHVIKIDDIVADVTDLITTS
jgi:hypothetical protein